MEIKSLWIGSFGKLKNVSLRFGPGCNLLYGENEQGKTTLLSFIKAMLYGFSGSSSDPAKNERRRYKPWSGEKMQGTLTLEAGGHTYRIERSFGATRASDKIRVVNLATGEELPLSKKEEPGNRLLGLGAGAFENTVFIGQLASVVDPERDKNGEILHHLENLVSTGDAGVSYPVVKKRLETAMAQLHRPRGGGKADRLQEERRRLLTQQEAVAQAQEEREGLLARLQALNEQKAAAGQALAQAEQAAAESQKQQEIARLQDILAIGERAQARQAEADRLQAELLCQGVPLTPEQLSGWRGQVERVQAAYREVRSYTEQTRALDALRAETLGKARQEQEAAGQKWEAAQTAWEGQQRAGQEIDAAREAAAQKREAAQQAAQAARQAEEGLQQEYTHWQQNAPAALPPPAPSGSPAVGALLALGAAAELAGILTRGGQSVASYVLSVVGAALLLVAVLLYFRQKRGRQQQAAAWEAAQTAQRTAAERQWAARLQEARSQTEQAQAAQTQAEAHWESVQTRWQQSQIDRAQAAERRAAAQAQRDETARQLEQAMTQWQEQQAQSQQESSRLREAADGQWQALQQALAPLGTFTSGVQVLERLDAWEQAQSRRQAAQAAADEAQTSFVRALNGQTPEAVVRRLAQLAPEGEANPVPPETESPSLPLAALRERTQALTVEEERLKEELKHRFTALPDAFEVRRALQEISEALEEQEGFYQAAALAAQVLDEAFEEMQSSFGPALNRKTADLLNRLTGGHYTGALVSRSLAVQVQEAAAPLLREPGYLSGGTLDQVYFSLRCAIAALLGESRGEALPLLLDDPFVQYDDGRCTQALAFLQEEAQRGTQSLLFTCHRYLLGLAPEAICQNLTESENCHEPYC